MFKALHKLLVFFTLFFLTIENLANASLYTISHKQIHAKALDIQNQVVRNNRYKKIAQIGIGLHQGVYTVSQIMHLVKQFSFWWDSRTICERCFTECKELIQAPGRVQSWQEFGKDVLKELGWSAATLVGYAGAQFLVQKLFASFNSFNSWSLYIANYVPYKEHVELAQYQCLNVMPHSNNQERISQERELLIISINKLLQDIESITAFMTYEGTLLHNKVEAYTIRDRLIRFAQEWRDNILQELHNKNMPVLSILIEQYDNQVTHLIKMFIAQEK